MRYGESWQRHAIDSLGGIIDMTARAITELAAGDLKQAQHTLGRARNAIADFQSELTDNISKEEEEEKKDGNGG